MAENFINSILHAYWQSAGIVQKEIMTNQSGFILTHLDVYSVAKCIITVKFLISEFAHFHPHTSVKIIQP